MYKEGLIMANKKLSILDSETLTSVSKIFKLLQNEARLSIIYLLKDQELSVGEITSLLNMEQSAVSHKLKALKKARLVKTRRDGKTSFYSLGDEHVFTILEQVITHSKESN